MQIEVEINMLEIFLSGAARVLTNTSLTNRQLETGRDDPCEIMRICNPFYMCVVRVAYSKETKLKGDFIHKLLH